MNDVQLSIAEQINALHAEAEAHAETAVQKAIQCGQKLAEQKAKLGHGKWIPWIESNLTFGLRSAQVYMRVAANTQRSAHLDSLNEAVKLLAEPRATKPVVIFGDIVAEVGTSRRGELEYWKVLWQLACKNNVVLDDEILDRPIQNIEEARLVLVLHDIASIVFFQATTEKMRANLALGETISARISANVLDDCEREFPVPIKAWMTA